MPRIDVRRILAVLLLLTLAPALSWAGQRGEAWDAPVRGSLLTRLWSFVRAVWEQGGSSLDPDGQPRPSEGGFIDPDG